METIQNYGNSADYFWHLCALYIFKTHVQAYIRKHLHTPHQNQIYINVCFIRRINKTWLLSEKGGDIYPEGTPPPNHPFSDCKDR